MTAPIEIEQTSIAATPTKETLTLSHLLKAWLLIEDNCHINQTAFMNLCEKYQLFKISDYHDTRSKRFQQLIQEIILRPILPINCPASQQKALLVSLCQWLIKNSCIDKWCQVIQRRLSDKMCLTAQTLQKQVNISVENSTTIKLSMRFKALNKEAQDALPLYEGKSVFIFQISDSTEIRQSLHAHAKLFETSISNAFITPPLDEQVNAYIQASQLTMHEEEVKILQASRDYYLDEITEQELQQHYISTNIYSAEFKNSAGYDLIKQIITCKPISGFSL